jgi:CobQ-like glutamine amidotransferase family enzyme
MTSVTIVQLYPDELGVAGDRGNVLALRERLARSGVAVNVVEYTVGDTFPTDCDLVVVGNGPLSAMRNVHADLVGLASHLRQLVTTAVPLFAYGSGAELLGHGIDLPDGPALEGLGILPFRAERIATRKVGYIVTETPFGQIVGFEDNASAWHLDDGASPLGKLLEGGGNSAAAGGEGVLEGALIGTQVGGPVLPLNPALTDAVIAFVAERSGFEYVPAVGDTALDTYAARAREVILANAKHVFSRI